MATTVVSNLTDAKITPVLRARLTDGTVEYLTAGDFKNGQRVRVPARNATSRYLSEMSRTDVNEVTYFREGELVAGTEVTLKSDNDRTFIVTDRQKTNAKKQRALRFTLAVKNGNATTVTYDATLLDNGMLAIGCQRFKLSSWMTRWEKIIDGQHPGVQKDGRYEYKTCSECKRDHSKWVTGEVTPNETAAALKAWAVQAAPILTAALAKMQRSVPATV